MSANWAHTLAEIPGYRDHQVPGVWEHTQENTCSGFLLLQSTEKLFHPSELRLFQQTTNNILKCSKRRRAWSTLRFKINEQSAYLSEVILKESMRKYTCLIIKGWKMTPMSMKHKDYDTQLRFKKWFFTKSCLFICYSSNSPSLKLTISSKPLQNAGLQVQVFCALSFAD